PVETMCPAPDGRKVPDTWFGFRCSCAASPGASPTVREEAVTLWKPCVRHLEAEKCRTPGSGSDGAGTARPSRASRRPAGPAEHTLVVRLLDEVAEGGEEVQDDVELLDGVELPHVASLQLQLDAGRLGLPAARARASAGSGRRRSRGSRGAPAGSRSGRARTR